MSVEPSRGRGKDSAEEKRRETPAAAAPGRVRIGGEGASGAGAGRAPGAPRVGHAFGWTLLPPFIWRRVPPDDRAGPQAIPSILHTGYVFSAASVVLDAILWLGLGFTDGLLFLLVHLLWISGFVSLLLLTPRFLEDLEGRPLARIGWANRLTVTRVFFLPLLVDLLLNRRWAPALAGYVLLGLTDVADGFVARHRREESKLGFVLDPFSDILFHLGILGSLTLAGVLSRSTGVLVLGRYLLLLLGCGLLYASKGEIWIQPTPFGKATGFGISALTASVLLALGLVGPDARVIRPIDRVLGLIFAAGVVHVLVIGWINFRRPAHGGTAVYRRGWGLLLGHSLPARGAAGAVDAAGTPAASPGPVPGSEAGAAEDPGEREDPGPETP